MFTGLKRLIVGVALILLLLDSCLARRRRRANEVTVVNNVGRNLKLRCQSILTDLSDQWLEPTDKFSFTFYDFDRGNLHFWCDAYGLQEFFEHFDVFGATAPSDRLNLTWVMQQDGLYMGSNQSVVDDSDPNHILPKVPYLSWWTWQSLI